MDPELVKLKRLAERMPVDPVMDPDERLTVFSEMFLSLIARVPPLILRS